MNFEYNINMQDGFNDRVVSPYYELFMEIIEEEDLDERFAYINRFIRKFTTGEDEHWYFCKDTNTQLVPKFFHLLRMHIS